MKKLTLELTAEKRAELEKNRDHHRKPYVRERCSAMLKIADGQSAHWVARHGLLKAHKPRTIYRWLAHYKAEGLSGLIDHQHGGNRRQGPDEAKLETLSERLMHQADFWLEQPSWQQPKVPSERPPKVVPVRWTLKRIKAHFSWLSGYSLSGIWRLLRRIGLKIRRGRPQQFSPDANYEKKLAHLLTVLKAVAANPKKVAALFCDEASYHRWPTIGRVWAQLKASSLIARRAKPGNSQYRIVGALDAYTGQVHHHQAYKIDRFTFIRFIEQIHQAYDGFETVYIILDNWSVHSTPELYKALEQMPTIQLVFLPTYSPWLNPIEKLWGWLKCDVIKQHRMAGDWKGLKQHVTQFLNTFANGSQTLLRRVGLLGNGKLAQALKGD